MSTILPDVTVLPRSVWAALPALTLGSIVPTAVAVVMAAVAATMVRMGGTITLLGMGLALVVGLPLVAGAFAALQAQCCDVVRGLEVTCSSWVRYLRVSWRTGVWTGLLTGSAGFSFLVALRWWTSTTSGAGQVMLVVALGCALVAGAVFTLSLPVLALAVPISLTRAGRPGVALVAWVLHLTARRPLPVLAVVALVVIMVVASAQISPSIMVLLPAPLALVSVLAAGAVDPEAGLR